MAGNYVSGGVTSLMVTSGAGYGVLAGNWLQLGYNPGGTPGICPSKLPRSREGTRADGWMDDHRQDGHSSVSPEDHVLWPRKASIFTRTWSPGCSSMAPAFLL